MDAKKQDKRPGLDEIAGKIVELKAKGLSVVMCHSVFDLLHIAHIRHFKQARQLGDVLVVTLLPDQFVNFGREPTQIPSPVSSRSLPTELNRDYARRLSQCRREIRKDKWRSTFATPLREILRT